MGGMPLFIAAGTMVDMVAVVDSSPRLLVDSVEA